MRRHQWVDHLKIGANLQATFTTVPHLEIFLFAFLVTTNEGLLKRWHAYSMSSLQCCPECSFFHFGKLSANTRNSQNCEILKHRLAGLFLGKFLQKLFHESHQKLRRLFDRYNWQSKNIPSFPKYLSYPIYLREVFATSISVRLIVSKVRFCCECKPGCLLVVAPGS